MNSRIMFGLKKGVTRPIVLSAIVLAVLLPVLHLHPDYGHEHTDHGMHHGTVIHADFFAAFARSHGGKLTDYTVWDESPASLPDQISLVTLASRDLWSFPAAHQSDIAFLLFVEPLSSPESLHCRWAPKREHPPPTKVFYLNLNSPRSPPQLT